MSVDRSTAARLFDLERRFALVETALHAHTMPGLSEAHLIRLYLDGHKRIVSQDMATAWVRQLYLIDCCALLALGTWLCDPHPFRPFLFVADQCCALQAPDAEAARVHILSVARDLLDTQGLQLVEPRDVMAKMRLREAVEAVR